MEGINYIATSGDTWDIISLKMYETEMQMHTLMEANPTLRDIVIFNGGEKLFIPVIEEVDKSSLPPWRA